MNVPDGLLYTEDHEWIRLDGGTGRAGITDFAQGELGDVVYVELPPVGSRIEMKKPMGVVESVKSMSDLYAPVSGTVKAVNAALADHPELVNSDPYGEGWMVEVETDGQTEGLLSAEAYRKLTEAGGH